MRSRSKRQASVKLKTERPAVKIAVGLGTCGIAAGGLDVYEAFEAEVAKNGKPVRLVQTGCLGMCYREVLVEVETADKERVIYGNVVPKDVSRIFTQHIVEGAPVEELMVLSSKKKLPDEDFLAKQVKVALRNCGRIDPEDIEEYIASCGYEGLGKVLGSFTPEQVIETVSQAGIRGRGGAGFPTGTKWKFAASAKGEMKYVICNADEGDPGAFMDRSVLEGDPHSVLEGMTIAGYAIGAQEGYIYVRAEYPLAIKRLKIAIEQARKKGFLGEKIMDSSFNFDIKIREGAGAFVCGEETALMASIEGKRGMPRSKPPFPAVSGLWGKPTIINNVETLANIPWIVSQGAEAFNRFGTEKSKGTKVFSLTGRVARCGLAEVPMGFTLREMIFGIGGGIEGGKEFKAVQIGGPSGGCIPASLLDTSIDYESLTALGAIMGSGGTVVMDETSCMVDVARFFLSFTQSESCGKCSPCRLGTKEMLEILTGITEGRGELEDLERLERIANIVRNTSLCALGGTAPNPVLTTLRYFRDEYETHVLEKKCSAGVCKALITYSIVAEACTGCSACEKVCPSGAITGKRKEAYSINGEICTKCGMCKEVCRYDAITVN